MFQETSWSDSILNFFKTLEVGRRKRDLKGIWDIVFKVVALSYSLFLIVAAVYGQITPSMIRGFFMVFVSIMTFIKFPFWKRSPLERPSLVDLVFIVLSIMTFGNFALNYDEMALRAGEPIFSDVFLGFLAVIIVLEGCRRAMSFILSFIALCFLLFAFYGRLPGIFAHPVFSFSLVMADIYASMNGIFGIVLYVFAAYVVIFIVMGAFFEKIDADEFFIDFPVALASKFRGGAAKAVVFTSLLFGMVSGSPVANTVATGTFTIPLMKRTGYRPEVAGAIEPAVDIGGSFMPPIMGAGAFLLAEMTHTPYSKICIIALVPALIYFLSTLVMIHFEALKTGIGMIPEKDRRPALPIFYKSWYYMFPLVVLFYLIFSGKSPTIGGFWAIMTAAGICLVKNIKNRNPKKFLVQVFNGLIEGGEASISVGSTAGPVGIIICIAMLTGLAFKFTEVVLSFTYGFTWAAILLILLTSLVLGMGITVTAGYMILATMAVPAMAQMGVPLIAAHFVAFWYSQSSSVTPPVCMSVFAGAAIAGTHPYKTAIPAMRFSAYMYIMPFTFVYTPMLMLEGFSIHVALTWMTNILSCIPFAAGMTGYFFGHINLLQRLMLLISCVLFLFPGVVTDLIGFLLMGAVGIPQYLKGKKLKSYGSLPSANGELIKP